jgi:hypothetical protein
VINDLVVVEVFGMTAYECDGLVKPGNWDTGLTKMVFAHHGSLIARVLEDRC